MKFPNRAVVTKAWKIYGENGTVTVEETRDRKKVGLRVAVHGGPITEVSLTAEAWKELCRLDWQVTVDRSTAEAEATAEALVGESMGPLSDGQ